MKKMKKLVVVLALCVMMSCAAWQSMSTSEKLNTSVVYYETFLAGLTIAATPFVGNSLVSMAMKLGTISLNAYKAIVVAYNENKANEAALKAAETKLYNDTVAANAVVGMAITTK